MIHNRPEHVGIRDFQESVPRRERPAAAVPPQTLNLGLTSVVRRGRELNPFDLSHRFRWRSSEWAACFPGGDLAQLLGLDPRHASTRSPRSRQHTGGPRIITTPTPGRPTYVRARGGFLNPVDFPPLEFGIAPTTSRRPTRPSSWGFWSPAPPSTMRVIPEDRRALDRDKVSVILGVRGTLELVIPLGARMGQPIWQRPPRGAGVPARPRRWSGGSPIVIRRLAGKFVPRPAGKRRRRTDRQPARPRGHQLRHQRGLRELAGWAVGLAPLEPAAGRCRSPCPGA